MEFILIWNPRFKTVISFIITLVIGLFFITNIIHLTDIYEIIVGALAWVLVVGAIPNIVAFIYSAIMKKYDEYLFVSLIYIFLFTISCTLTIIYFFNLDLSGYDFTFIH